VPFFGTLDEVLVGFEVVEVDLSLVEDVLLELRLVDVAECDLELVEDGLSSTFPRIL
jgi:hypothetical protein